MAFLEKHHGDNDNTAASSSTQQRAATQVMATMAFKAQREKAQWDDHCKVGSARKRGLDGESQRESAPGISQQFPHHFQ
eukprot:CAMPEP_0172509476 /NCGR_PEP_ID=MMETSP1066-20121228/220581_1 /TAXON_ID=671091 /ORGANISM="Coscinodiscus wailesii, Strain CCMP2513" /LENGTH=78 /DNA_ID=CAMNT_0013287971 /DNA_START=498 /DNA_END=734 /DNA_ORIENTATION=-